jgi:hypothetical protein
LRPKSLVLVAFCKQGFKLELKKRRDLFEIWDSSLPLQEGMSGSQIFTGDGKAFALLLGYIKNKEGKYFAVT